jgi:hypothetical protein
MGTNYIQTVELTDEEKFKMYMKLSKKEIVKMHIELEWTLKIFTPRNSVKTWPDTYPSYENSAKPFQPPFIITCADNIK